MRAAWDRWQDALARREGGESLALFRVFLGLCVLALLGSARARGLVDVLWVDLAFGGYRGLGNGPWLVKLIGSPEPGTMLLLNTVGLLGGALLVVGAGGRLSALVTLACVNAIARTNGEVGGGYDMLLTNGLWLLVLADASATLSLRAKLRTGRWMPRVEVAAWPRALAIYQLCLMYFWAGAQKIGASWTPAGDFSALYYILQQPSWQRWDMSWVAPLYPLTQLLTALTLVWELLWPVVGLTIFLRRRPPRDDAGRLRRLLTRDWRLPFCVIGVGMHTLTWVFLEVGPFSFVTMSFYACLFRPDELAGAVARLRSRLRGAPLADDEHDGAGEDEQRASERQ
jgi:hypothetical protein